MFSKHSSSNNYLTVTEAITYLNQYQRFFRLLTSEDRKDYEIMLNDELCNAIIDPNWCPGSNIKSADEVNFEKKPWNQDHISYVIDQSIDIVRRCHKEIQELDLDSVILILQSARWELSTLINKWRNNSILDSALTVQSSFLSDVQNLYKLLFISRKQIFSVISLLVPLEPNNNTEEAILENDVNRIEQDEEIMYEDIEAKLNKFKIFFDEEVALVANNQAQQYHSGSEWNATTLSSYENKITTNLNLVANVLEEIRQKNFPSVFNVAEHHKNFNAAKEEIINYIAMTRFSLNDGLGSVALLTQHFEIRNKINASLENMYNIAESILTRTHEAKSSDSINTTAVLSVQNSVTQDIEENSHSVIERTDLEHMQQNLDNSFRKSPQVISSNNHQHVLFCFIVKIIFLSSTLIGSIFLDYYFFTSLNYKSNIRSFLEQGNFYLGCGSVVLGMAAMILLALLIKFVKRNNENINNLVEQTNILSPKNN
jgi:hypothetical protein